MRDRLGFRRRRDSAYFQLHATESRDTVGFCIRILRLRTLERVVTLHTWNYSREEGIVEGDPSS